MPVAMYNDGSHVMTAVLTPCTLTRCLLDATFSCQPNLSSKASDIEELCAELKVKSVREQQYLNASNQHTILLMT